MRHLAAVVLAVVLAVALCGVVGAHQTVVVKVTEPGLHKAAVTVDAGDLVVWANLSAAHLTISFSGGKELWLLCGVPTRFYLGSDDTYTSGMIPPGTVASLCFAEPGVYQYTVSGTSQGVLLKGIVTVK
jgi:plastocyanin